MTSLDLVKFSFSQNILVYGAYLLVPLAWFVLNKTTLGLKIRSVGENPDAADSLGVSVARVRYFTIILGGTLSGLAGASLSIASVECLPAKHDQWTWFYCGCTGILWRMASGWCVGRCIVVQHGQLSAIVDPGIGYSRPFGNRGDDALRAHDPGFGCDCFKGSGSIGFDETL